MLEVHIFIFYIFVFLINTKNLGSLAVYFILFVLSLSVLLFASDKFIESAEKIGLSMGISPFIIGVTIVAFGTSLPELATSLASVFSGSSEVVVGNVVGSNITNILLVLGVTGIISKEFKMDFDIMDVDMPLLLISALLLYFVLSDQVLTFPEVILFIIALVVFLANSVSGSISDEDDRPSSSVKDYIFVLLGIVFVFLGARYTIHYLELISTELGIDPELIALTVVALGTSLPEVIVSVAAARKGKHAIAVGNVLGSNIFNTYAVMGIPALFGTLKIPDGIISFGLPFMLVVTFIFALVTMSRRVSRWEACMLLVLYGFYIIQLIDK